MVIHGFVAVVLNEFVALGGFEVFAHHFGDEFVEGSFWCPAELFFSFGGVTEQSFYFCRAEIARINADDAFAVTVEALLIDALPFPADFHAQLFGGSIDEIAHAVLHAGSNHEILRRFLLQHQPLHFDVVLGVTPVALGVHVAKEQAVLQPELDPGQRPGDLAGDEGFAADRAFVVEQDAVAGIDAVGLTVVHRDPVGVEFGDGVGAARVEGGGLLLRGFLDESV